MKRVSLSLLSALLVSGCMVGPDFHTPAPPTVTSDVGKGDAGPPDDQRIALLSFLLELQNAKHDTAAAQTSDKLDTVPLSNKKLRRRWRVKLARARVEFRVAGWSTSGPPVSP